MRQLVKIVKIIERLMIRQKNVRPLKLIKAVKFILRFRLIPEENPYQKKYQSIERRIRCSVFAVVLPVTQKLYIPIVRYLNLTNIHT